MKTLIFIPVHLITSVNDHTKVYHTYIATFGGMVDLQHGGGFNMTSWKCKGSF